ncbi:hypothetical protein POM88_013722 [Heracleum sosnowskyi]|uniref:Uncharacterized protein n=1 Tax=Heracleum sosnowskyi TaxID=360622 RepID=A0AAD8N3K8_9APIA|nr:hypothetical protein POM88_013722 [Heracleum sosnowskyi]
MLGIPWPTGHDTLSPRWYSSSYHAQVRRCREILCGSGNIDPQFITIYALASHGHFTSMVANFVVRHLYKYGSSAHTLQSKALMKQKSELEEILRKEEQLEAKKKKEEEATHMFIKEMADKDSEELPDLRLEKLKDARVVYATTRLPERLRFTYFDGKVQQDLQKD